MQRNEPLLSLFALLATAAATAQSPDGQQAPELARKYGAVVAEHAKTNGFTGSVLVARDGAVLYRGSAGLANLESQTPNRPTTAFRVGSITKQFTAALVMQLVDEGVLDLDGTVSQYLTDYREDTGSRITLRHLLTHSSGLPNYTDVPDLATKMRQPTTVAEFVTSACSGDLEFEPGTQAKYCNSGYFLLGAILEAVTGQRYDSLLHNRIVGPLGLENTGYDRHQTIIPNRARGHERVAGTLVPSPFLDMNQAFAAGALYSTVNDLARWSQALTDGRVMSDKSRNASFTRHQADYGYGWVLGDVEAGGDGTVPTVEHGGSIPGFRSKIRRFPDSDALLIVLSNCRHPRATDQLIDALTRLLHDQTPESPSPSPGAQFWKRVHAGDLEAAERMWHEGTRPPYEADDSRALAATAALLIGIGHQKSAASVLRTQLQLWPDDLRSQELLASIEGPSTQAPQFIEQHQTLRGPAVWSEAVKTIDYNQDGRLDLLFANCNGWRRPGDMAAPSSEPLAPTLLRNGSEQKGQIEFVEVTSDLLPEDFRVHAKNVVVCDVDADGADDLIFAVAFGGQQRLLRFDRETNRFVDETEQRLPELLLNSNGVGWGDLDDDGDPDLVFVDSGPNSDRAPGGKARLLINDGRGFFREAASQLPSTNKIGAQNPKLIDIDSDLDLDIIVDGKSPQTQLYLNDGRGNFQVAEGVIPDAARNGQPYEIEWADLDNDGDLDAVHMSWGGERNERYRNSVLRNQLAERGSLSFDVVIDAFEGRNNEDENEFALLDANNDGLLDLVVATLVSGPTDEKLFLNSGSIGTGFLRQQPAAFSYFVDGTLDATIADFDGDGRYDIATAQGESKRFEGFENRLYRNFGPRDSRPPRLVRAANTGTEEGSGRLIVRAALQDAVVDDDQSSLTAEVYWAAKLPSDARASNETKTDGRVPMQHIGGGIFRATLPAFDPGVTIVFQVHAVDRAGNASISDAVEFESR